MSTLRDAIDQLDGHTFKRLNQWMTFSQITQNTKEQMLLTAEKEDMAYPYPMPHYAYKVSATPVLTTTRRTG